ncbi:MAG: hypothetical protein E7242_00340 [Lachnospiraceae bacterium]|nr:hypothetical protein [Lachnospiraceae bacterium]
MIAIRNKKKAFAFVLALLAAVVFILPGSVAKADTALSTYSINISKLTDANIQSATVSITFLKGDNSEAGTSISTINSENNYTINLTNQALPTDTAKVNVKVTAPGIDTAFVGADGQNMANIQQLLSDQGQTFNLPGSVTNPNLDFTFVITDGGSGTEVPENFGLLLHLSDGTATTYTEVNPYEGATVIVADSEDISNLEFMIDEFIDYTDYDNPVHKALENVGTNSGAEDAYRRNPLEVQTLSKTADQWNFNLMYHAKDDPVEANRDCPEFYVRNITIISSDSSAVQVAFYPQPFMYQDTVYSNKVNITGTTAQSPAQSYVYYDSEVVPIWAIGGKEVMEIKVADGFNADAVTIIDGNFLSFNSGYYATIPLVITLDDGTVGYLDVNRLGLSLDFVRTANRDFVFHGSQEGSIISNAEGVGAVNVVATFYYPADKSYSDYDIVANLTYADGREETKIVQGFGETDGDVNGDLKAGDYLVWSGASEDEAPVTVSVTAVKHGAISADTFGGAVFGGGAGVTKTDLAKEIRF